VGELSLASMTKNHLMHRVAAAVMPVGRRAGYAQRAVVRKSCCVVPS
jgi:hypothetical protein